MFLYKIHIRRFREVLLVLFCILSDVGGSCSSKKRMFDVTINPESCPPEVSKLEFIYIYFKYNIIKRIFCSLPFRDFRGLWIRCGGSGYVKKKQSITS